MTSPDIKPRKVPGSILFACTHNMIRSPMAEAIMKQRFPNTVFVDSCGIHAGSADGFVTNVMQELGIDISGHTPKNFDDLEDEFFDMIICFSEDSRARAEEFAAGKAMEVEYWPVYDVALTSENQQLRLNAYRVVRDTIIKRIEASFPLS